MSRVVRGEVDVEGKIVDILERFVGQRFNGVTVSEVVRQWVYLGNTGWRADIDIAVIRRADIAVIKEDGAPLLLVEVKYERGFRAERKVLGQVFSYAAMLKGERGIYVPFVAAANEGQIAVFAVPEDIDSRVDWDAILGRDYGRVLPVDYLHNLWNQHLIFHKPVRFTEDFFKEILETITSIYVKRYPIQEPPIAKLPIAMAEDLFEIGNWRGGVLDARIVAPRCAQYLHRFTLVDGSRVASDADLIVFIPKQGIQFDVTELKALLAYLNSSFTQLHIELVGRVTGGGALALEVDHARGMPILDVKELPRGVVERLAELFDKLEAEAGGLGGADEAENVFGSELARELTGKEVKPGIEGLFNTVIKEIDYEAAKIWGGFAKALGLGDPQVETQNVRSLVLAMVRRRLVGAGGARPSAIRGSVKRIKGRG